MFSEFSISYSIHKHIKELTWQPIGLIEIIEHKLRKYLEPPIKF